MSKALKNSVKAEKIVKTATPQTVRTPGRSDEVCNNAGGFVFEVSDKSRLERFLILGTDGGTYYVGEKKLTKQNTDFLRALVKKDEAMVLKIIVEVSEAGRAYSNSGAIYALALVMAEGVDKAGARAIFNRVVRTSTHLFEAAEYVDSLGGWGRAKRKAFASWYEDKNAEQLAYQAVKYRQRNGWTHRDVMRLAHPEGVDKGVGNFILGKMPTERVDLPVIIAGFGEVQAATSAKEVVSVLNAYKNLPWETIPTQFLTDAEVWKTLFRNGQLNGQALVRNITRLARNGAFKDMMFAAEYAARLTDVEMIRKARLHPINYLNAAVVYRDGQVPRNSVGYYGYGRTRDWDVEGVILDAINDGFHASFKAVEPANKRTMLAVDVSQSMSSPALGLDLSCAQVSGAMAMTIARTEPAHIIRGFSSSGRGWGRGATQLTELGISAKSTLADAMRKVQMSNFGSTDCALPMVWALENSVEVDTFVVITDNETYAGTIKPTQALKKYRDATGIPARLAVFGVASTGFTIADPKDRGQLDFVGFDSNAPRVLADFSAGRL